MIEPVVQRIAELWTIQRGRQLTQDETMEFAHAMNANAKYWWEMAYLRNLSLMASMTNDIAWQHEVCLEIDRLQLGEKKKPGRKGPGEN
nr:hypothetical protein [Aneurinibacillus sp. XH2]